MPEPYHRWGVRFTSNSARDKDYLQDQVDDDASAAKRGELFLNEPLEELYYADAEGVVHRVGDSTPVAFSRINFSGIRTFTDDVAAAAATPPVPVGGLYRTGSILKVRVL